MIQVVADSAIIRKDPQDALGRLGSESSFDRSGSVRVTPAVCGLVDASWFCVGGATATIRRLFLLGLSKR